MRILILLITNIFAYGIVTVHAGILAGPVTNSANGHVYYLLTSQTWNASEAEAVSLGGHLATIRNAAENNFVYTNFSSFGGTNRYLWIGLNDLAVRGTYQWASGEASTYRHWEATQPTLWNGSSPEDCGSILAPNHVNPGQWNDANGQGYTGYYGVVEVIPGIASQLNITTAVELSWTTQTTNSYQIQWAAAVDTNTSTWYNLGSTIQGTGSTNYFFDSIRSGQSKFYRVLTLP